MPYEFRFPDVGEGIASGELVEWKVKVGDSVKADQILAEIETDKAVVEIPSPKAGAILSLNFKPGDTIKVGDVLVVIGEKGDKPLAKKPQQQKPESTTVVGSLDAKQQTIPSPQKQKPQAKSAEVLALPAVRKAAKERGIDLAAVSGTGQAGSITMQDLVASPAKQQAQAGSAVQQDSGQVEIIPVKGIRKTTAERMILSVAEIPHVTHMDECDVTALWHIRERFKDQFRAQGIHLTFLPFIMKAVIAALRDYPILNSSIDMKALEITVKKYYNIGVAMDVKEGLMVPVIKDADKKSILDIAKEIQQLSKQATDRTISLQDMKGGTFTITNVGTLGGRYATPIINYPEAAILAVGHIYDKVTAYNGKVVIRKYLPLSLAFDHRIVDGAYAAQFTNQLMAHLQEPDLMLLERD